MDYRKTPFLEGEIYHLYNRGVEKRKIFLRPTNYQRFLEALNYYSYATDLRFADFKRLTISEKNKFFNNEKKLVEIICYCLMPNHFHILVKQLERDGITRFMSNLSNSYTKYFNTKYDRVGPLLQGIFKAVHVSGDTQLLQVSRYIHLNSTEAKISSKPENYFWSSFREYTSGKEFICNHKIIKSYFEEMREYLDFCNANLVDSILDNNLALEEI